MKKKLLFLFCFIAFSYYLHAQDFKGQWKGEFIDNSSAYGQYSGDRCEYVLELDVNGKDVSGYSYTYFLNGGTRYYTICKLAGYVDKKAKFLEVTETERTKTNVPKNMFNCFQIHKLTYLKKEGEESLGGEWIPAPNQNGDCGYGTTSLTRRVLANNFRNFSKKEPVKQLAKSNSNSSKPLVKTNPIKPKPQVVAKKPMVAKANANNPVTKSLKPRKDSMVTNQAITETPRLAQPNEKINMAPIKYEKRDNNLLKTIEVEHPTVRVDLYDNGEIDGDSISLFYNDKLLVSRKKLSAKSITLNINVDEDENELMMYAENLGSIPPNTALMVVTDGAKRYEVRITSDLKRSGVIRFIHKKD